MFLTDLIQWWYFCGWGLFFSNFKVRLSDTLDMFSFGEMLRTLFKPYRQISANASGSIVNRAIDKLISRFVGMFARLTIILAGLIVMILEIVFGMIVMITWPVMPMLPIAGAILMVSGVII